MRIHSALTRFLTQLQADGRSPHTIGQYRRHVRLFARWAAKARRGASVARIDHEDLAAFLTALGARLRPDGAPKKPGSANALRSSLRGFFTYLQRSGQLAQNPARLIRRAVCSPPPPRALADGDRDRLLRTLARGRGPEAQRDHALFHLLLATGIRLGSALGLDVEDIDLRAAEVRLRHCKGGREERVFLGSAIRRHLRRFLKGRPAGPLFTGRAGTRICARHVQRRLGAWLTRAGIERHVSPHALRHSFAMDIYRRSGDIHLVQRALRHRSIASTLVYARADDRRLRLALAQLCPAPT